MADSWEDAEEQIVLQPNAGSKPRAGFNFNPNAPTFSFNPGAAQFTPGTFQQPPPPARQQPAPPPPRQPPAPSPVSQPPPPEARGPVSPPAERDEPMVEAQAVSRDAEMAEAAPSAEPSVSHAAEQLKDLKVSNSKADSPPAAKPVAPAPSSSGKPEQRSDGGAHAKAEKSHSDEEEEEDEAAIAKRNAELKAIYDELSKEDGREHLNAVFIGHVDAGKSTIGGQILYLTGGVDERTIQKYEREAKEKNRESWYMAYIMDTNEEERAKGKTVEVGRAHFATSKKRYTILDAPGHKNYVPNMISGAAQADVGVLVIAARKGEFETGFERGGQTREHAQLAKTLGVAKLIVVVNKMDDPSTAGPNGEWSQERYNEIQTRLTPFLRSCGYNPKKDIVFLPISGLLGLNIKEPVDKKLCPWYSGGTLFDVLDAVKPLPRDPLGPFRMSVIDKYKDMGTIAMGKSEAGIVRKGDRLYVMPNKVPVTVTTIYQDDQEVSAAKGGENLRLRLTGIDEEDIAAGFVICSRHTPVPAVTYFDAQLQILDLLEHKAIFTAGYKAVLHLHSLVEECEITALLAQIDVKTKEKKKAKFVKSNQLCIARVTVEKPICVEKFEVVPQLGRFTLRDEGRTIAIGKIVRVPKSLKE